MSYFKTGRKHTEKRSKHISFMVMSDPTKGPKTIRIPKWVKYPIISILVIAIVCTMHLNHRIARLEKNLVQQVEMHENSLSTIKNKNELIADLEKTNDVRYEELTELRDLTFELGERLEELEEYKTDMDTYKEEIDTKLTNTEVGEDTSSREEISWDEEVQVALKEEIEANVYPLLASPMMEADGFYIGGAEIGVKEEESFSEEVSELTGFLEKALDSVSEGVTEFEETSKDLESMISFADCYPSIFPVSNPVVVSPFGYRRNPFGGGREFHYGVDLKAYYVSVNTTASGVVKFSGYTAGYGYCVLVDHGYGITTRYAHLSSLKVKAGEKVEKGQIIAKSGNSGRSTGPHLHYEIKENGEFINPLQFIYDKE